MPKTANDTDDNMREPRNVQTRQMEKAETTRRYDKGEWNRELQESYTATWASPGGNARRKIDFITINAKYRNMTRKAQGHIYWHADMNQNQHHRVQTMQLYYNASMKYRHPIPAEAGARLEYDIGGNSPTSRKINQMAPGP